MVLGSYGQCGGRQNVIVRAIPSAHVQASLHTDTITNIQPHTEENKFKTGNHNKNGQMWHTPLIPAEVSVNRMPAWSIFGVLGQEGPRETRFQTNIFPTI